MEYQKIANLLNFGSNKPSKFRTRNCIEINDEARSTYSHKKQIKFKTSMLRSSLCDYSDAYILAEGNITVNNTAVDGAAANNAGKKVIFKYCAPFTNRKTKINNTQIDKTSGSLGQYCKEIPAIDDNGAIVSFNGANATNSFNFKTK